MSNEKYITLSQLLTNIRQTLAQAFPLGVWISAEIGSLNVNRYSGHCYMELIEKSSEGGSSSTPQARVQAAVWRSRWGLLSAHFASATGMPLAEGMKVLLKVSVNFHEAYGLSLVVNDIDPTYTLGERAAQRQQTIEQLRADGVFDLNKALELPTIVQRIAIVSSATAAGLQDFMRHIEASPWQFYPTLYEATMQGSTAEESIIAALGRIAEADEEYDAVVVIRGGGSQSDLECFNSYAICANLAQFPLPIITGIGHDRDESVADLVAHTALKTPTAVADFLVERIGGFMGEAEYTYEAIVTTTNALLTGHTQRLERNAALISSGTQALLRRIDVRLEGATQRLSAATTRLIDAHQSRLERIEAQVEGNNPRRILALGFAVVRSGGKALTNTEGIVVGDSIDITMADGTATAQVTNISKPESNNN